MMLRIPQVLSPEQVARCQAALEAAEWVDGRVTAGHQSTRAKHNLQLAEGSPLARELGGLVLSALEQSPLFISAALPKSVFPPLFNRYEPGMTFGSHVDNAIRQVPRTPLTLRSDVSATLFLSPPESYDGGELVVEDTYGQHASKLPAGDLLLYPASSVHHVTPITRGVRLASFFWTQSLVRDAARRALLFDLDSGIREVNAKGELASAAVVLTGVYNNLLRQWAEV